MIKKNIIVTAYILFFLICAHSGESIEYEIKYKQMEKGVTVTSAQQPGKGYFKVYLDQGEEVWIQIIGYMSSDVAMEINNIKYIGTGSITEWSVPFSHKIRYFEVVLWREKYKYGEGPDPQNKDADKLVTEHYFLNEVDRDGEAVR